MKIDLSGVWKIGLGEGEKHLPLTWDGTIHLPGILQAQGYGDKIDRETMWVSGLHDDAWYLREDYGFAQEEQCNVPFLSQPPRHYIGKAYYQREILVEERGEWLLFMELTRWQTSVWLDGIYLGGDSSLCTAHEIPLGFVDKGMHQLTICVDNSMIYPYRPDGHGVSDALSATWNGVVGELSLLSTMDVDKCLQEKVNYVDNHPRTVEIRGDMFYVDGAPEYIRATHFGGDYPLTGYPETNKAWWDRIMGILKEWGLNTIRCHSCCPPEAGFQAADEAGIYLLVECGMWNVFNEGISMLDVLKEETRRILRQFGHHPSFILFSPTNEPDGSWYQPLRHWVTETREYDQCLGYANRRLYTAQSGWFYDVPPKDIDGTDFIYFHRSAYGPILGGNIRNYEGWKGRDYAPSLEGTKLPVICHEMGQWCSYPDFDVIDKFTGYMQPGNYRVFKENAIKRGVYGKNKDFAFCSGKNQVRMYKEDLEANFRTPHMYGFELLDLHDYLGQGTALVGVLDAFWDKKGYVEPEEWRQFCNETVILARIPSYVYKSTDKVRIPVEICHFGREPMGDAVLSWSLKNGDEWVAYGELPPMDIPIGKGFEVGNIGLDFSAITCNVDLILEIKLGEVINHWDIYVYSKCFNEISDTQVVYTKEWSEAKGALEQGKSVVFTPYLSSLDYNCPPLAMRSIFWNSQMGPNWIRPLGLVIDDSHPVFRNFPTKAYGGWQWEDILAHARGFYIKDLLDLDGIIVQPVDDWNRNTLESLIFEGCVGDGKLLVVSADLEGSFEERPEAYSLKKAVLAYAASSEFIPKSRISVDVLEQRMMPNYIMKALGADIGVENDGKAVNLESLLDGNPNTSALITADAYPISVDIVLPQPVLIQGLVYMADQKDRMHEGDVKDYQVFAEMNSLWIMVAIGSLLSTHMPQNIILNTPITSRKLRFTAQSGYQPDRKRIWENTVDGWYLNEKRLQAKLGLAILNVTVERKTRVPQDDTIYWNKNIRSTTKEIDD